MKHIESPAPFWTGDYQFHIELDACDFEQAQKCFDSASGTTVKLTYFCVFHNALEQI